MLIRLLAKCKVTEILDYQLIDVLRAISMYNRDYVIGRSWLVSDIDIWTYAGGRRGSEAIEALFPERITAHSLLEITVTGERLLERSALIHQIESGLFLRVADASFPVNLFTELRLKDGPPHFQASNVDLEIRCDEASAYEVISLDQQLIECLQNVFNETEIEL